MALTKAKKQQKVKALAADLQGATAAIIGTFSAMTASKDIDLRKTVRAAGGKYSVLKNKLAPKAGEGTQIAGALGGLKGVSSVAYTSGDPVALAKALAAWVKDNSQFTFKLGIVDGKVLDVSEVQALATMPGKEELFAKLLWLINAPAQRLATVINATGRDLAVVINQGVEKEKFSGSAPAASSAPAAPVAEAAPAAADTEGASPQVEAAATEAPAEGA
jgi:large subunit ribosomal protein L10